MKIMNDFFLFIVVFWILVGVVASGLAWGSDQAEGFFTRLKKLCRGRIRITQADVMDALDDVYSTEAWEHTRVMHGAVWVSLWRTAEILAVKFVAPVEEMADVLLHYPGLKRFGFRLEDMVIFYYFLKRP